jgi:hypothetical protein
LHMSYDLFNLIAYLFVFNPSNMLTDFFIHNLYIILTINENKRLMEVRGAVGGPNRLLKNTIIKCGKNIQFMVEKCA